MPIPSVRFSRTDTHKSVDIFYDPTCVKADPKQMELMKVILQGTASKEEKKEFGRLWQHRVKKILIDNFDNAEIIRVQTV